MIVAASSLLSGQATSVGNLSGTVSGPGRTALPGALVRVDTGRGIAETRTDAKGHFLVPQLLPGNVKVTVTSPGMVAFKATATIISNQNSVLSINLAPVAEATIVVVATVAPEAGVDPGAAVTGQNFDAETIAALPYLGNSPYDSALKLLPGTPSGGYNFHGSEDGGNSYTVNGVESRSAGGGIQLLALNPDLIEQFNVLTAGVSAKYGRFVGGIVNTVTKSGTNEFTGSVRHDLYSDSWNALPRASAFTDSERVPRHVTDYQTYTFLGPIIKDKLFFAVGYSTKTPGVTNVVKGQVASGLFPAFYFTSKADEELKDIKLDWQVNNENRVSATWSRHVSSRTGPTYGRGLSTFDTSTGASRSEQGYTSLSWTSTLTNTLLLDVITSETLTKSGGPGTGSPGGAGIVTWKDAKGSGNGDLYENGTNAGNLNQERIRTLGINLSWSLPQHSIETGFQYYRSRMDSMGSYAGQDGGWASMPPSHALISFYGWNSASPSSMDRSNRVLVADSETRTRLTLFDPIQGGADTSIYGLYANDAWTITPKWTLNAGVRYDHNRVSLDPEGDAFTTASLTPRATLSYDVMGNTRHVLSLGLAEYAGQYNVYTFSTTSASNTVPVRLYRYYGAGNGSDALNADGTINWNVWGSSATTLGQANPYHVSPNSLTDRQVTADPGIKAPRAREATLSYHYADESQSMAVTLLHKIQDNYVGLKYLGVAGTPADSAKREYFTDKGQESRYEAIEVQYRRRILENFQVGGNITWSYTRANAGQGASSNYRNNFGDFIANDLVDPFGPQPGQWSSSSTPFTAHLDVSYKYPLGKAGKLEFTLLGNYWSKSFSGYRSYEGPTTPEIQAYGYPSTVNRSYADAPLWWPEKYDFDLHVGYEVPVHNTLTFFAALDVINLFNHMQPMYVSYSTALTDGTKVYAPYDPSIADDYPTWWSNPKLKPVPYNDGWLPDGTTGDYTAPRKIQVRVGFRF